MKNRASALEARKRAKQKEADLEKRFLELELENEIQKTINMRLKALIEKYTSRFVFLSIYASFLIKIIRIIRQINMALLILYCSSKYNIRSIK